MLLALDVGNSNIVLGVFSDETLTESWRLQTSRDRTSDELGIQLRHLLDHRGIDTESIDHIVIASVVPQLTGAFVEMAHRYFEQTPLVVDASIDTGMPVLYDSPDDVGADRIVNAVAAFEAYGRSAPSPLIVVDFGTATTFDAVSAAGEYLGGVICPGIQISADALFQRAAKLPRVDVRKPSSVIGNTTVGAIQSGLYFGYVAMVEGLVARIRQQLADRETRTIDPASVPCIATGGMAEVLAAETPAIDHVDLNLTLTGLRLVWERHR